MSKDGYRDALAENLRDQILEVSKVFTDLGEKLANQHVHSVDFLGKRLGVSDKPTTAAKLVARVIADIERQRLGLSGLVRAAAEYDFHVTATKAGEGHERR